MNLAETGSSSRAATPTLGDAIALPCGAVLKNRLVKAAMTEGLADAHNRATERHVRLYGRWARGGAGMLLTGNVQVDRRYLERPGNVVIEGPQSPEALAALRAWSAAATADGTHCFMQISHAGRQTQSLTNKEPVAPSAVQLKMPGATFGRPRALTEPEILDVIARFAHTAKVARETGFTGVQVHAAHGYLLSEFLSPDVNLRTDAWGGSLENRSRLLLEVIRAVRAAVGSDFPVTVKLNSADFQRGGFTHEEAVRVAAMLDAEAIDLLEISGGTYEQPRLLGLDTITPNPERAEKRRESTIARESYFLDYARDIRAATKLPLMVTGGFRTGTAMNAALASRDCDLVGVARPFCVDPEIARAVIADPTTVASKYEETLRVGPGFLSLTSPVALIRSLNGWGTQGWFCLQLLRMGDGKDPDTKMGVFAAFNAYMKNETNAAKAYHAAI